MKRYNIAWAAVAATLLLASCTQQDEREEIAATPTPLAIGSVARGRTDAVTRTDATEIISSGKLWVGVRGEGDYTATGSYETGMIYACTGSQWAFVPGGGGSTASPGAAEALKPGAQNALLFAFYPAGGIHKLTVDATTKAATVALEAKFYTNFTQTDDFCYATKSETDANLTSPSASFRLQSPYARITLSITRQGYACTAISELKLWIEQTDGTKFEFASTGTVNIQTGATSASGKVDELTLTDPASVTLPDDYSPCTIDLLLPSQTLPKDGKLCVSFKADTEPGLFQVSCSEFDASSTTAEVALKAGTQYKIPIQITRTGMGSDGPVDVGVKDIEVYFAPGNLRAVPDGKGGYTYSFAEEQGATLLTAEQLDEIQNNSILSISSSTSIDLSEYFYEETLGMVKDNSSNKVLYNKEKDPCAQVGDGKWRIPTKEEAELIVKLNPQRVCWDNSTQYYGLSCGGYQGTVPNKLFIPEIGYYADIDGSASIIGFNSHSFVYLCWGKTDNLFYEWVGYTEPLNGYTEISSYLATDGIYEYSQLMKFRYPIRCVRPKTEATP